MRLRHQATSLGVPLVDIPHPVLATRIHALLSDDSQPLHRRPQFLHLALAGGKGGAELAHALN
jgi:hypothetical protein